MIKTPKPTSDVLPEIHCPQHGVIGSRDGSCPECSQGTFMGPCSCADSGKCQHNEHGPVCMQHPEPRESSERQPSKEVLDAIAQGRETGYALGTRDADVDRDLIFAALVELGRRIEACGASVQLTNAVTLCSDLRQAIGNQWNAADQYAEQRVRDELRRAERQRMHDAGVREGLHPPVPPKHKPVA